MSLKKQIAASWDPQGMAMMDYFNGKTDAQLIIHENEEKTPVPVEIYFRDEDSYPEIEQYALHLCHGKVLDIGAGSGCHSLTLMDLGFDVHAIDISPIAAELMRLRGVEQVYEGDIFEIEEKNFDTLLMLMNGIGFVKDLKGLEHFFHFSKTLLKPDGQMIFDSTELYNDKPELKKRKFFNRYYGITEYRLEYDGKTGDPFSWLYIDPKKLNQIAKKCGWHCQIIYEDLDGHYLARLRLF